jgi:HTH-type transcriptional regulator, transcriptional repressor of NAD biosynthesis genes
MVDQARREVPVSGTAVRADPAAHWDRLEPPVRAWFAKRIVVVGAESTGTTTLARALAEHYDTAWVPEYGRRVSEERLPAGVPWSDADFEAIARRQQHAEDEAARTAGPVLICDTDALATCVWQERYLGRSTRAVEELAASRRCALYLLTADDIPFVQDGLRDGEHLRGWMTRRFRERLAARPEPHVVVGGDHARRLAEAVAAVDEIVASGWELHPPLEQLQR